MVGLQKATAFHRDVDEHGQPLTVQDRERLLRPYLPSTPSTRASATSPSRSTRRSRRKPVRHLLRNALYSFAFTLIHFAFSIYIRLRQAYHETVDRAYSVLYYHHRSPDLIQRDIRRLPRLPDHLSIILDIGANDKDGAAVENLIHDVCEVAAWSACAGIPRLSIYERTGVLKASLPQLHRHISKTMSSYFGATSATKPTISLRAPHIPSFSPPSSPSADVLMTGSAPHLSILLLSASDGRRTLVDLTKTLTEMSQKSKLAPEDISADLIDAEISESVMDEPDLLMLFGDSVVLQGYPPWQVRLTEIFHVPDNNSVGYQVFLRGLRKYASAQMRFGS